MDLEELAAWIDWELLGNHEDSTTASSGSSSSEEEESDDSFYTCDEFSSDGEASAVSEDIGLCAVAVAVPAFVILCTAQVADISQLL